VVANSVFDDEITPHRDEARISPKNTQGSFIGVATVLNDQPDTRENAAHASPVTSDTRGCCLGALRIRS
jgi:hypothetical protein